MSSQIQDFKLPNDWQNSNPQTFEGLASSLEQIHKNAYSAFCEGGKQVCLHQKLSDRVLYR